MKVAKTTPWVVATAFLSVLILGAAWVLVISPQLDRANTALEDAARVETQNMAYQRRLAELRDQFEHLDEYKADLAAIQVQIPPEDGEPAFYRELVAASAASGAFLVSILTEGATDVEVVAETPNAGAADPNAGAAEPTTDAGATPADEPDAEPTAPATVAPTPMGIDGFVAIPFTITVLGSYDKTVQFVQLAQESFDRLFVVTGFTVKGQPATPPTGGRPEVQEGDAEFEVRGFAYVLQDSEDEVAPGTGAGTGTEDGGTVDS